MKLAGIALLATALSAAPRPLNTPVTHKAARVAPTFVLDLKPGVPHTFETRNLSKGADTVLVILDDERPLDWNDDRGRKPADQVSAAESVLTFTAHRRAPFSIQVRAADGTLEGECDLYMDGKQLGPRLKFGARHQRPRRRPMLMPRPEPRAQRDPQDPELETYELPRPWR